MHNNPHNTCHLEQACQKKKIAVGIFITILKLVCCKRPTGFFFLIPPEQRIWCVADELNTTDTSCTVTMILSGLVQKSVDASTPLDILEFLRSLLSLVCSCPTQSTRVAQSVQQRGKNEPVKIFKLLPSVCVFFFF